MEDDRVLDLHGTATEEARPAHLPLIILIDRPIGIRRGEKALSARFADEDMAVDLFEELPQPAEEPGVIEGAVPQQPQVQSEAREIVMVEERLTAERAFRRQSVDGEVGGMGVTNRDFSCSW